MSLEKNKIVLSENSVRKIDFQEDREFIPSQKHLMHYTVYLYICVYIHIHTHYVSNFA